MGWVLRLILIRHNNYTIMVMKLTPSLEENTVQDIDMKCFFLLAP